MVYLSARLGVSVIIVIFRLFLFQAVDGIRDKLVTGVQTCALPIYRGRRDRRHRRAPPSRTTPHAFRGGISSRAPRPFLPAAPLARRSSDLARSALGSSRRRRSEERRVGKEW